MIIVLQDEQKIEVLTRIKNKEITMEGAAIVSKDMKELNLTKEKFLKHLNMETWQEAQEKIPKYATESKLKLFSKKATSSKDFSVCFGLHSLCSIKIITILPKDFCEEAKLYGTQGDDGDLVEHLTFQGQRIQLHLAHNLTAFSNVIKNYFSLVSVTALKVS